MKIAVICVNELDFILSTLKSNSEKVHFYAIYHADQMRGINFNGLILTDKAFNSEYCRNLYNDCLRLVRFIRV